MLSYVPAETEDIPAIFRFCEELIDRYEDPETMDISRAKAWTRHKIEEQITDYRIVLRDGEKAGYFHLIPGALPGEEYELDDLYILPEFQGQGIGTEVLRHCITESGEAGIFLYVFKENHRAVSLYEQTGFTVRKTVGKTRLIMVRPGKNADF